MSYNEVVILIPSHSLEDFPTDLNDDKADSLLNSFSVAFHPALLAMTGLVPSWQRADEPIDNFGGKLYFLPTASDDMVPAGWAQRARDEGAVVAGGPFELDADIRQVLLRKALEPILREGDDTAELPADCDISAELEISDELVQDFFALGTCWIVLELVTRHMHHFSSYDEVFFEKTVVQAAKAAMDGDEAETRDRLQAAYDLLAEARERFYPVDSYFIDVCLLTPDMVDEEALIEQLAGPTAINFLLKAKDVEQINEEHPEFSKALAEAWASEKADIAGGDYEELASPLVPLESTLWDLEKGREVFRRILGREPTTWGRRRFGLSQMTPQLLQKSGFHAALHFLLDDGIYPDREQSKLRWEAMDSSSVDAYSRLPMPTESPGTWLKLPERLAETMESDQVAAIMFARWPEVKSVFYHDLRRTMNYAPVLGRFVTLAEFFQHTDTPGGMYGTESKEYLAPFFVQAVARREPNPITRFADHYERNCRLAAADWQSSMAAALCGKTPSEKAVNETRALIEPAGPDVYDELSEGTPEENLAAAADALAEFEAKSASQITRVIMHGAGDQPGWLVTNPLSFRRWAQLDFSSVPDALPPQVGGHVKAVQFDDRRKLALVDLPAAGFAWIPASPKAVANSDSSKPLAEDGRLQNEFFDVAISERTGGLQHIKKHGRHPKRISQQLAFRFLRELTFKRQTGEGEFEEISTWYSEMHCSSSKVTCAGPGMGEIVTEGGLMNPQTGETLAAFRQTFRVWRGRPYLEIDIELEPTKMPDGDPWSNYYGARFAWNDSTASISQSIYGAAQPIGMQRIESPEFIEIASTEERTTILPFGLPFHRKTGPRMIDSILICDGEQRRKFRMAIAFDHNYPIQAALDHLSPVTPIATENGPPSSGDTGWFYKIDSRCVLVTRVMGLLAEPLDSNEVGEPVPAPSGTGFALRLQETEGRYQNVFVEFFRTPTSGRVRDFRGRTISDLPPVGDGVQVDLSPFGIVDVEVRFDG
jgi:alpha-mannosidase